MNGTPKWVAIGVVLVAVLGAVAWYGRSQSHTAQENAAPHSVALSGETICLPHKAGGTQTTECAMGLKASDGKNYVLDFNLLSSTTPQFTLGTRVSANGIITPIAQLDTDRWQSYDVAGIFSVTDNLQIETPR